MSYIEVLEKEISVLKARIQPAATGHLHTTIGVLEGRIRELMSIREEV